MTGNQGRTPHRILGWCRTVGWSRVIGQDMRLMVVMLVVLGSISLRGFGQGDGWEGELRLRLAWPEAAKSLRSEQPLLASRLMPMVVMRRTADGSVRSRYGIVQERRRDFFLMEDQEAAALSKGLTEYLKSAKQQSPGQGVHLKPKEGDQVAVYSSLGLRTLTKAQAGELSAILLHTRKRAKAFIGADIDLKRDAIRKLEGPVIEGWSMTLDLGEVDLPELGGRQRVWWRGEETIGWAKSGFDLLVRPQDRPVPGAGWVGMSPVFFEQLGRVPDVLAQGKSVRWEGDGQMLRAFVENKAIFYRPDTRKGTDIRISLETAQEAWKVLEKRDRAEAWFGKTVAPGLEELMQQGRK